MKLREANVADYFAMIKGGKLVILSKVGMDGNTTICQTNNFNRSSRRLETSRLLRLEEKFLNRNIYPLPTK